MTKTKDNPIPRRSARARVNIYVIKDFRLFGKKIT